MTQNSRITYDIGDNVPRKFKLTNDLTFQIKTKQTHGHDFLTCTSELEISHQIPNNNPTVPNTRYTSPQSLVMRTRPLMEGSASSAGALYVVFVPYLDNILWNNILFQTTWYGIWIQTSSLFPFDRNEIKRNIIAWNGFKFNPRQSRGVMQLLCEHYDT